MVLAPRAVPRGWHLHFLGDQAYTIHVGSTNFGNRGWAYEFSLSNGSRLESTGNERKLEESSVPEIGRVGSQAAGRPAVPPRS